MVVVVVGIDIGTSSTKVNLGPSQSCEIVRTLSGGHTTPTAVSFSSSGPRQIGETASLKGSNAIIHLNRLLRRHDDDDSKDDPFAEFYVFEYGPENTTVTVEYNNKTTKLDAAAVLAALLGKIQQNVYATMERLSISNNDAAVEYNICIPSSEDQVNYLDAAYAASMKVVRITPTSECYGAAYSRKFPEYAGTILIVDMGHGTTTVSIVQMSGTTTDTTTTKTEGEEEEESAEEEESYVVLNSATHACFGGGSVDIRLWNHFQSELTSLHGLQKNSRKGQRLLEGCKKLKHLLSQLSEGSVMVENVGENDTDLHLKATKSTLATMCEDDKRTLMEFVQSTIEGASTAKITSIEVLGGGCRIPWVQDAIMEAAVASGKMDAASITQPVTLSHSLDDTSLALGAALIGEQKNEDEILASSPSNNERRENLLEHEKVMAASDEEMIVKAVLRNKIESHILEIRSAKHNSKHGTLLPTTIDSYLNELDDWLFSEDCDTATKEQMKEKYDTIEQKTKDVCHEYYDAIQKETAAKELEMEEEAKKAQLERNAGQDDNEDDHDNRRLPKKRRMEIVMKNKTEANELFSDGNYKFAAARYTKALSHCAKFVDLSPKDTTEVDSVKLSLNLNLALAYTKLKNMSQALRVCNDALLIDAESVKALYRRALVKYEIKHYDKAKEDVLKALTLNTTPDKAITKLNDRIDWMIKRQKDKERKMAQKMFG